MINKVAMYVGTSYMEMLASSDQNLTFPAPTGPTMAIILVFWSQLKEIFFKVNLPPFFVHRQLKGTNHT